jgi:hypothetical protein
VETGTIEGSGYGQVGRQVAALYEFQDMSPKGHTPTNKKGTGERLFLKPPRNKDITNGSFLVVAKYIFTTKELIRITDTKRLPSEQASCTSSTCAHRRSPDEYRTPNWVESSRSSNTGPRRLCRRQFRKRQGLQRYGTMGREIRRIHRGLVVARWFLDKRPI